MIGQSYEVVIIGGGHAGLAVSYHLKKEGIHHIVLERGLIGESWRSQRWDTFTLNTINSMNVLPGDKYEGDAPDNFASAHDLVKYLENYVVMYQLPVQQNVNVISIEFQQSPAGFLLNVSENGNHQTCFCTKVVIASGIQNKKQIPSIAAKISKDIIQLHAGEYRNSSQLPDGAVLVIGSGQSGGQIAEDLLDAGRKVYLSTSKVGRVPRWYRGKDVMDWFLQIGFLDLKTQETTDPEILHMKTPQMSGNKGGHTVSLQYLAAKGAVIIGKLDTIEKNILILRENAVFHVQYGDAFSIKIKEMIDEYISKTKLIAPPAVRDEADDPDINASCANNINHIDLEAHNIKSVIWTTGFTGDFSYIRIPVLDENGMPCHKNGISEIEGLYFIGFPWLRSRKSGIILGIMEDAAFISGQMRNTETKCR